METVVVDVDHGRILQGADGRVFARELLTVIARRLADLECHVAPQRRAVGQIDDRARRVAELVQQRVLRQIQMPRLEFTPRRLGGARCPLCSPRYAQCCLERAGHALRIEQGARQVVGSADAHGLHGAQLVTTRGDDHYRRAVRRVERDAQHIELLARIGEHIAAVHAQHGEVDLAGMPLRHARHKLRRRHVLDADVRPEYVEVVAQPVAQLTLLDQQQDARIHRSKRMRMRVRCATGTPSRTRGR